MLLTWDQTGQYEVAELRGDGMDVTGDWMTTLLQTKAFHRIPPANIQAIFMRMQRINYRSGDIVIKQGTEGDYFYVVVAGKCVVTRETPLNKEGIKLEAREIIGKGGRWLDVRLPSEFQNFRIDGAVNIPLYFIRLKLNALDKNTQYIVCCDTGRRSSAAAYILSERGFEAYVLKGGLAATEAARSHGG